MQNSNKRHHAWTVAAAVAGITVVVAVAFFLFGSDDEPVLTGTGKGTASPLSESIPEDTAPRVSDGPDPLPEDGDPIVEDAHAREALSSTGIFLSGRVIDKESGDAVPVFGLRMCRRVEKGADPWKEFFARKIENHEGSFHVPLDKGGRIRLWVRSASHHPFRSDVDVPDDAGLGDQLFELDPGAVAVGIVVDDATGDPIEGAVVAHVDLHDTENFVRLFLGLDSWMAHAVSGSDGRFRLSGLYEKVSSPFMDGRWRLAAVHPDYAEGVAFCVPESKEEVMIRLGPGRRIFGRVLDDDGNPAASAVVCLSSKKIPLPRPVLTGPDGTYRTAPARPDLVFVSAGPPPGRDGVCPNLTEEIRRVRLADSDVEVNFGQEADHVTWKGTVRFRDGSPMPRATIKLTPAEVTLEEKIQSRLERSTECDDEGRFEIRKMAAKSYVVDVDPSSWAHDISIGKLVFDRPGLVEQDIVIAGAEIHGLVVEKTTRKPISKRGWVRCFIYEDGLFRSFSCPIGEDGRFSLLGIPAGTHRVSAHSTDFPGTTVDGVVLAKDEILHDLIIEVSEGGIMNIKIDGFAPGDAREFRWNLGLKGGQQYTYGVQRFDAEGKWEVSWDREPGVYVTHFDFAGLGTAVREFEIFAGRTTTVSIHKSALSEQEETVTVSGTVRHPDGSAAAGVRLHFFRSGSTGKTINERSKSVATGSHGEFTATGFWIGSWMVSAIFEKGATVEFPDLVIPPDPPAVVTLDLVLSTGTVSGALRDKKTGRLLDEEGPLWWVFLREVKTRKLVSEIQGGQRGSHFTLRGVPAGDYMLRVSARYYRESNTGPYSIGEGEVIDIGTIDLDPAGILILEIVDQRGDPVTDFELTCDGETAYSWARTEISAGRYEFFSLPVGKVILVLTAEGYMGVEIPLDLEPGVPCESRIVLTAN